MITEILIVIGGVSPTVALGVAIGILIAVAILFVIYWVYRLIAFLLSDLSLGGWCALVSITIGVAFAIQSLM